MEEIKKNRAPKCSFMVTVLAMASTVFCLVANIVSGRLGIFADFGLDKQVCAPMGVFFFPFIYIISDILSEVYGYRISRWVSWITSFINVVFVGMVIGIITLIKPAAWCLELDGAIKTVLATSFKVIIGSILGSVLAGWVNDVIFQYFKHKDGDKGFAKRKILSSLAAEIIDTLIFISIAFIGTIPFSPWSEGGSIYTSILTMYVIQFAMKYLVEVITEPLAHLLANKLKKLDPDAFEDRNNFNIFGFEKKIESE